MDGSFEPGLIKKGQTRIDGMDDKIIGLTRAVNLIKGLKPVEPLALIEEARNQIKPP